MFLLIHMIIKYQVLIITDKSMRVCLRLLLHACVRGCVFSQSAVTLSFTLAFFWPSTSAPAHYCVALIWKGQDWVQKCIYLPAQIGPLSVWSLLSLLLKDSEQRKASFSMCVSFRACVCVCVCVCGWVGASVCTGELRCVPAGPPTSTLTITSLQQMQTKEEYISLVILIPLNSGGVLP